MKALILFAIFAHAQDGEYICVEKAIDYSPLLISEAFNNGEKVYENLRDKMPNPTKTYMLPRLSIVEVDPELYEKKLKTFTKLKTADRYIPVKVIKTAPEILNNELKQAQKYWMGVHTTQNNWQKIPEPGTEGILHVSALEEFGKYSFILNKDAILFDDSTKKFKNELLTILRNEQGQYLVQECCRDQANDKCQTRYQFHLEYDPTQVIYFDNFQCHNISALYPILNEHANAINNLLLSIQTSDPDFTIDKLVYFHNKTLDEEKGVSYSEKFYLYNPQGQKLWKELTEEEKEVFLKYWAKLKTHPMGLVKIPVDKNTDIGPFNSIHYHTAETKKIDNSKVTINDRESDHYAQPTSACAFLEVINAMNKVCPETDPKSCQTRWGHFYHRKQWSGEGHGHRAHYDGTCVDILPFKTEKDVHKYINQGHFCRSDSDIEKNKKFIEILAKAGAAPILINLNCYNKKGVKYSWLDKETLKKYENQIVQNASHSDHFHVCFPPAATAVKNACLYGVRMKAPVIREYKSIEVKNILFDLPEIDVKKYLKPLELPKIKPAKDSGGLK
ncbi:MAG: hypothetical protein JNM93_12135 [Bacteriovoracaceae bacterium]|nr:hypothetical protein [Bacteriovoracaceae bacterium]